MQGSDGENEPDLACGPPRPARASRRPTARSRWTCSGTALETAGVDEVDIYRDLVSGLRDGRPGSTDCRRVLREGEVLVARKVDRLGRNLARLVDTVRDLSGRGEGVRVLAGDGVQVDTTTAADRLVFGICGALAEFEWEGLVVAGRGGLRGQGRGYADAAVGLDALRCMTRSSRNSLASRRLANAAEELHSPGWSVAS